MKYFKYLILTIILVLGISFPSCSSLNCSCPDETFFNVEGLDLLFIMAGESVEFNDGKYIHLDYQVDYHTQATPQWDWSFSLMNSAYACSCIVGAVRSKEEKLVNLSIITLNDFDDDHLANSDITDLLEFKGHFWDGEYYNDNGGLTMTEYVTNRKDKLLDGEDIVLKLLSAPTLNESFKIKVVMELSDGEIYEIESETFSITP